MNNHDYPQGADNKNAPWNLESKPFKKVEVTASITVNKTIQTETDEYENISYLDEDNNMCEETQFEDFVAKDLANPLYEELVKTLPDGWTISDFEAIIE